MRGREKIAKWCILLLLFLFSSFTSPFLFLSSLTFNSLFWLPWLLCPLVLSAVINSMGTVPIYTQIKSMWFLPLTPLLHQPLLFAAGIYHARRVPTTFWPLARALSLSLFIPELYDKFPPLLGKTQFAIGTSLSLSLNSKTFINSLCPHSLVCIKWLPLVSYPFWQKCFPNRASPKRGFGRMPKLGLLPPSTKPPFL